MCDLTAPVLNELLGKESCLESCVPAPGLPFIALWSGRGWGVRQTWVFWCLWRGDIPHTAPLSNASSRLQHLLQGQDSNLEASQKRIPEPHSSLPGSSSLETDRRELDPATKKGKGDFGGRGTLKLFHYCFVGFLSPFHLLQTLVFLYLVLETRWSPGPHAC